MSNYIPWGSRKDVPVSVLVGLTLSKIEVNSENDEITFIASDGREFRMFHDQDCCESVDIESIVGDLSDLVGEPITLAEEVSNSDKNPEGVEVPAYQDSFTWTFYKFATRNGYVDIRWYGESNGYYSEEVSFVEVKK